MIFELEPIAASCWMKLASISKVEAIAMDVTRVIEYSSEFRHEPPQGCLDREPHSRSNAAEERRNALWVVVDSGR